MPKRKQTQLTQTITKLEERGVIGKRYARAARWLVRVLESPLGRLAIGLVRYVVVKTLAELILGGRDNR